MGTKPATLTPKPPAVLAAERAETDAITRALRLQEAEEAIVACGIFVWKAGDLVDEDYQRAARRMIKSGRVLLLDGSDEPRLAACDVALEALGRLWCCP